MRHADTACDGRQPIDLVPPAARPVRVLLSGVHFSTYALLDLGLLYAPGQAFGTLLVDIAERPYITVGFTALLLLIPLAVTSTHGMQRRLGRNWAKLHRLVYVVARARRRALLVAGEIRPRLRRAAALRVSSSGAPRRTAQAPTSRRESRRGDGVSGRRATTGRPENQPLALRRRAGITHLSGSVWR